MALQFVSENGQLIPPLKKPDNFYKLNPTEAFDFEQLIERTSHNFRKKVKISADQFEEEFNRLRQLAIEAMPHIDRNVILPCLMPVVLRGDIGSNLVFTYIQAVKRSYEAIYPKRNFYNSTEGYDHYTHRDYDLKNRVYVSAESGHLAFLRKNPLVFVYIADCMRNWTIYEQHRPQPELIKAGFSVAGGYDGLTALALHPEVLAGHYGCPFIRYSGIQIGSTHSLGNGIIELYAKGGEKSLILSTRNHLSDGNIFMDNGSSAALSFFQQ